MAIQSLFGPSVADIQELRRQQAEKEIASSGQEFGVFAPLYQAGLRFGNQAVSGINTLMGVEDPMLRQATAVQSVLGKYQGQDLSNPLVLTSIGRELMTVAPEAGVKAMTLAKELAPKREIKTTQGAIVDVTNPEAPQVLYQAPSKEDSTPQNKAERDYLTSLQAKYPDTVEGRAQAANDFATWKSSFRQKEAEAGVPKPTLQEKALMPGTAETRADILKRALNAQNTVFIADSMDRVLSNAFVGAGATAKLTLGQIATALGVEVKGVSETEQLNSLLAALTQGQARNLPGALSDKDVLFLKEAIGKGSFTIDTLRSVTKQIKTEALAAEIENDRIQQIINTGGDLNKFDFVKNKKSAMAEARTQIEERNAKLEELRKLRQKRGF